MASEAQPCHGHSRPGTHRPPCVPHPSPTSHSPIVVAAGRRGVEAVLLPQLLQQGLGLRGLGWGRLGAADVEDDKGLEVGVLRPQAAQHRPAELGADGVRCQ